MTPLLMEFQFASLRQGPPIVRNAHPENRVDGVGLSVEIKEEVSHLPVSMY